jgi:hypothetical protein
MLWWQEVVGSSGVMGTLSWLSVSGTNMVDLAEWLERLTANAVVATVLGFDPSVLRHSGIWGAADEAVLTIVHKKKKIQKSHFKNILFKMKKSKKSPFKNILFKMKNPKNPPLKKSILMVVNLQNLMWRQPRRSLRPTSVSFCQYCRNLSHETVTLSLVCDGRRWWVAAVWWVPWAGSPCRGRIWWSWRTGTSASAPTYSPSTSGITVVYVTRANSKVIGCVACCGLYVSNLYWNWQKINTNELTM